MIFWQELTKALDAIKAAGSKVEEVVKERQSIEKIVEINKKVIRPSKRDLVSEIYCSELDPIL
jgi:GDP-D-mannose dehydratase